VEGGHGEGIQRTDQRVDLTRPDSERVDSKRVDPDDLVKGVRGVWASAVTDEEYAVLHDSHSVLHEGRRKGKGKGLGQGMLSGREWLAERKRKARADKSA
jgi:hypothetical protein